MTSHPVDLDRYIALHVAEPLDRKRRHQWHETVRENAPSGVLASHQVYGLDGHRRTVCLIQRSSGDGHCYMIPLARDLSDDEVETIVHAAARTMPDQDFDVETQQRQLVPDQPPEITLDDAAHLALCTEFAKRQHEAWMRERSDAGWRFGPKFSTREKTHPLLRPWHDLPDRFRQPDLDWPQRLVKVLLDQGYAVISKDDLARLMQQAR